MAVFKQELNWSTHQDNQLKILQNIESSIAKDSNSYLRNIDKNVSTLTQKLAGNASHTSGAGKATEGAEKFGKATEKGAEEVKKFEVSLAKLGENLWRQLGGLDGIGRELDRFSAASNQMIQISGMHGDIVREFRSDFLGIISDLNATTGLLYHSAESYERVISWSQGVTSNLDAIEEMARPLLLTYETLDVNIGTVAELMNRFYTRYNFSSREMEVIMNEIRGNTAGNSANAEATLENIQALENWINVIAMNDNDKRTELLSGISHYTSWLESMEIDSAPFTKYLEAIAYGDWGDNKELLNILNTQGIDATQAQYMARDGQWEELTVAIAKGMEQVVGDVKDVHSLGAVLDNLGIERDMALSTWSTMNSAGYTSLEDFIAQSTTGKTTMESLAESKYVSFEDKITNQLNNIAGYLANIQERIGFGVTDLALLLSLTNGVFSGGGGIGGAFFGKLKDVGQSWFGSVGTHYTGGQFIPGGGRAPAGGAYGAGTGLIGLLQSGGTNLSGGALAGGKAAALGGLGIAGIAGGGVLAVDGIAGLFDENASTGGKLMSGVEAAGGAVGAGALIAGLAGAAVAPWIAPVALAVGGIGFLGKKAYEEATALSGNAELVSKSIKDIESSLLEENDRRLDQVSQLSYAFNQETDLEKQRELLLQSGLFTEEELQDKNKAQLEALISSYQDAASAMDETSKRILGIAENHYSAQQDSQQKDLIDYLKTGNLSQDQKQSAARMIRAYTEDEDLSNRITKYLESDNEISDAEWRHILSGKHWFDDHNLTDTAMGVSGLRAIAGATGYEGEFSSTDNMSQIIALMDNFSNAVTQSERDAAFQAIQDSGLESEIRSIQEYSDILGVAGYAKGSNYITHDQIALLHEGEAVVPKRYNPMANISELESLRERLNTEQRRTIQEAEEHRRQTVEVLSEIKEFLSEWKEDNIKRDTIKESKSRFSSSKSYIANYMAGY